jgi:hypothetical protein
LLAHFVLLLFVFLAFGFAWALPPAFATMAALWNQTRGIGIGLQGQAIQTFNSVSDLIANTVSGGCYFADGSIFPIGDGFYYLTRVASRDSGNGSSSFLAIGDYSGKSYIGTIAIDGVTLTWAQLTTNDSPAFTGTPTAPTAVAGTNTDQIATMAALWNQTRGIGIGLNSQTSQTFNTVSDLTTQTVNGGCYLANGLAMPTPSDAYYMTRIASRDVSNNSAFMATLLSDSSFTYIGQFYDGIFGWIRLASTDSPSFTGVPTAPTAVLGTNTTQLATTAFVASATTGVAPLASPIPRV